MSNVFLKETKVDLNTNARKEKLKSENILLKAVIGFQSVFV